MTPKERVLATLEHREPDRVPWGEWAIDHDTVAKVIGHETYLRAKAASQIGFWEGRRDEVVQSWREDTIEFHRRLPVFDAINLGAMTSGVCPPKGFRPEAPEKLDESTWRFADGRVMKYSAATDDITLVEDPQLWTRRFRAEDFPAEPEVEKPDESVFEVVDAVIAEFGSERFIMGPSGGEVGLVLLGGFERGLVEIATNPDIVKAATRSDLHRARELDRWHIRPAQDAVAWGQDFAFNSGPFVSPETFRELVLPALVERVRRIHSDFGLKVINHCCGNTWKLLDMFVEAGFDCYQSIQGSAGMDLARLKREYGGRLALMGGVPVETLVSGTPADVRREVRRALEIGKPGGGYIFGSSHSIAVGTSYDNFMAMADEFEKRRDY